MEVHAMLCRVARVHDGLLDVEGAGINRVRRPSYPAPLNNFLALMLSVRPSQTAIEQHHLKMVLQDADGNVVSTHDGDFVVGATSDNRPGEECYTAFAFDMRQVVLPKAGAYSIEILMDGQKARSIAFLAVTMVLAGVS